uniref:AAA+ ATPase domain-containing protein n=1 Tax=Triticum urartu TaxID=4572 RepID=A0A8R7RGH9_TRIUA
MQWPRAQAQGRARQGQQEPPGLCRRPQGARSLTTSLGSPSGGTPPRGSPRPTSSAYTPAGTRGASTGSSSIGGIVTLSLTPTFLSSSTRAALSLSRTANAASSPTMLVAVNPYQGKSVWSHVPFEHPATFDTLAMHPDEKEAIIDDLVAFQESKEYYAKVGKAWKRGYLLYGPPGTGKFTMIAAMANFLDYDIDCSVDFTGKRHKDKKASSDKDSDNDDKPKLPIEQEKDDATKVTLSGLLNFIDGLWSACGGDRIIIFTTNHKEKLDPALIRWGRMDKHIEMSYCRFEGFKVLAKNYLDVIEHELFGGNSAPARGDRYVAR